MPIYQYGEDCPVINDNAYVSPDAIIIGRVTIEAYATIWPGAVLRGDNERITIGSGSNVQDGAILHTDPGFPLVIHESVTVGHQAMLHGCTIEATTLIGMQALILNGAHIGSRSIVAAGALITQGKKFEQGQLLQGRPATPIRPITESELAMIQKGVEVYCQKGGVYKTHLKQVG